MVRNFLFYYVSPTVVIYGAHISCLIILLARVNVPQVGQLPIYSFHTQVWNEGLVGRAQPHMETGPGLPITHKKRPAQVYP